MKMRAVLTLEVTMEVPSQSGPFSVSAGGEPELSHTPLLVFFTWLKCLIQREVVSMSCLRKEHQGTVN